MHCHRCSLCRAATSRSDGLLSGRLPLGGKCSTSASGRSPFEGAPPNLGKACSLRRESCRFTTDEARQRRWANAGQIARHYGGRAIKQERENFFYIVWPPEMSVCDGNLLPHRLAPQFSFICSSYISYSQNLLTID